MIPLSTCELGRSESPLDLKVVKRTAASVRAIAFSITAVALGAAMISGSARTRSSSQSSASTAPFTRVNSTHVRSSSQSIATGESVASTSAVIRVNQLGYTIDGPKRAYLMSRASVPAGTFSVADSTGTSDGSTRNTDLSTRTTESSTITTDRSTGTTESSTITTDLSTGTTEVSARPTEGSIGPTAVGSTITREGKSRIGQFSGNIGADQGGWGRFRHVYAMDFDSLSSAGSYTITVNTPSAVITSPEFGIDTASNIYSTPLANTLYFYQNERDGQDFIPTALRTAPGHLNDASAVTYKTPRMNGNGIFSGALKPTGGVIDASGGWWDAGDYLKFVETHSYAVALLLIGVRDFPQQMGAGSVSSDFTSEAEFGLEWLQRMWDDTNSILYYQVGVGEANSRFVGDHDIWRLPQADDDMGGTDPTFKYIRNRPVFIAGNPGSPISPNLAGRLAADFALGFQMMESSQPDLAATYLLSAEHIFDLANTNPKGKLLTVAPFDFYPETEWRDDLELGATELYFALAGAGANLPQSLPHTDPQFYLTAAARWANAYITGPNDDADSLNLYDVSGLAHFELYRAMALAGNPTGLEVGQSGLLADMKKELDIAVSQAGTDPFGYGTAWDQSDSATRGTALSIVANEYDFLTGGSTYAPYAARWLDAVLGANAWGTSFIVGDGVVFPFCMQHQVANIVGSTGGAPPILKGALVEGPNSAGSTGLVDGMVTCPVDGGDAFAGFDGNGAVYIDNVQSFATVEPAIDLTSPSPLAFAWRISGGPAGNP
jgi:endoglucanase